MEERLKKQVLKALEAKLGCLIEISQKEWEDAKRDALNDIYIDKLCFLGGVTNKHFVHVMVSILYCAKRVPASNTESGLHPKSAFTA